MNLWKSIKRFFSYAGVCPACNKPMYNGEGLAGISPPASCRIHSACWEVFRDITLEQPHYRRLTADYEEMLDLRDKGLDSSELWKEYQAGRRRKVAEYKKGEK